MKKTEKEQIVKDLSDKLGNIENYYLVDFKGITVSQSVELRRLLRENSYSFQVVKNRLALRALGNECPESLKVLFQGPTAIAFAPENPIRLAKILKEFYIKNNLLTVKGGILEGQFINSEKFDEVSKIGSREELLANFGFLLAYPLMKLIKTWQAPLVSLGGLLSQLKSNNRVGGKNAQSTN
ncbi:MAG: 50S ribosomal protein L10 [Candidatus Aminicenantales bacterium]